MQCHQCGLKQHESAKFCIKCGALLGSPLRCAQCGSHNPKDSKFCMECGEKFSVALKVVKGTQRKCKNCGHFNDLDALFCVTCGEKLSLKSKKDIKQKTTESSFKNIFLIIAGIIMIVLFAKQIVTNFKGEKSPQISSPVISNETPLFGINEEQVIAVAQNFKCACGGCGELPLETCTCDMPKGSVEEKNFIRGKLAEGLTVEQVIEMVDKKYGHRI